MRIQGNRHPHFMSVGTTTRVQQLSWRLQARKAREQSVLHRLRVLRWRPRHRSRLLSLALLCSLNDASRKNRHVRPESSTRRCHGGRYRFHIGTNGTRSIGNHAFVLRAFRYRKEGTATTEATSTTFACCTHRSCRGSLHACDLSARDHCLRCDPQSRLSLLVPSQ